MSRIQFVKPSYEPSTEYAFKGHWAGTYCSEILLFVGSLSLFSVFILMAIFWADLLKGVRSWEAESKSWGREREREAERGEGIYIYIYIYIYFEVCGSSHVILGIKRGHGEM